MVSKELVGERIRQVRTTQRKTLKDVENVSGFSSTHISEIERGRTSPTIGALIRIANALDKDPSYFIEEREVEEVCVSSQDNRPDGAKAVNVGGAGVHVTCMTTGILGGRLLAYEISIESDANGSVEFVPQAGDLCLTCVMGACGLLSGGHVMALEEMDCMHVATADAAFTIRGSGDGPSRLVVFLDPKEAIL